MFVSKKKYNEMLRELIDTRTELKHERDELKRCHEQLAGIESRITTLEDKTLAEGKRLTEEELSTLIAVDFLRIIHSEENSRNIKLLNSSPLFNSLVQGLQI